MNQLQAVAMNEGYRWKKKLFSGKGRAQLEKLSLASWASRCRKELLELLDQLDPKIAELTAAVEQEAHKQPEVLLLMTHPGVGPITGLVYVLVIGTPDRFPCGKQIGSYTGLIPSEDPSAGRQRAGTYQQTRERVAALLAGGSIASSRTVQPRLAASVCAPGDASAENDQPVVDCAHGYQKETQDEAHEVEENCGQESGVDEEGGKEKAG